MPRSVADFAIANRRVFETPPASSPLFFGLEGRPCVARGEPRFAAEPREYGRPHVRGRVQDNDTHRRSPSPQQPEADFAGARQRPFGCGLGTRRPEAGSRTRPRILALHVIPGLRPGSLRSPGLAPGYARSPAPRAAFRHRPTAQVRRAQHNAPHLSSPCGAHRATHRSPTRRIIVSRQTTV